MKKSKFFQQAIYWPTLVALRALFSFKVFGQENLQGLEDEPVIFCSNHITLMDGFVCAAAMPRNFFVPRYFFPIKFLVTDLYCDPKKNPLKFPLNFLCVNFLRINEVISVQQIIEEKRDRRKTIRQLKEIARRVKENSLKLWIFPGGRRNSSERLERVRSGVVELHHLTNAPIIPVALVGLSGISWKSIFKKKIGIQIGEPIYRLGKGLDAKERLKKEINELYLDLTKKMGLDL